MGSCVSVVKDEASVGEKMFISEPVMEKGGNGGGMFGAGGDYVFMSQSRDFGSKEEAFFDSQAWLDSDCEDDFLSVNGDFTPSSSCGNTPNRLSNFEGTPLHIKPFTQRAASFNREPISKNEKTELSLSTGGTTPKPLPETSPTDQKKKLFELFEDNIGGEDDFKDSSTPPKSSNGTPYLSVANSNCSTPSKVTKPEKQKLSKSVQCCMPSLLSSRNSVDRQRKLSPANNSG